MIPPADFLSVLLLFFARGEFVQTSEAVDLQLGTKVKIGWGKPLVFES